MSNLSVGLGIMATIAATIAFMFLRGSSTKPSPRNDGSDPGGGPGWDGGHGHSHGDGGSDGGGD